MAVSFSLKFEGWATGCQRIALSLPSAERHRRTVERLVGRSTIHKIFKLQYGRMRGNGGLGGVFGIEQVFLRKFLEACGGKGGQFGAGCRCRWSVLFFPRFAGDALSKNPARKDWGRDWSTGRCSSRPRLVGKEAQTSPDDRPCDSEASSRARVRSGICLHGSASG